MAAAGAAVLNIVSYEGEHVATEARWLLTGSVAIALLCVSLLNRTIDIRQEIIRFHRSGARAMFFAPC